MCEATHKNAQTQEIFFVFFLFCLFVCLCGFIQLSSHNVVVLFSDGDNLSQSVLPFAICHFGGQIVKVKMAHESLFSCKPDKLVRDERGECYKRQKPVSLYKELIALYGKPLTWILDICSGAGKLITILTAV